MKQIFKKNKGEIVKVSILRNVFGSPIEYTIGTKGVKEIKVYPTGVVIIKENETVHGYFNCMYEYVQDKID